MSVNIKTTTGLKQLTGYNLTSAKVVAALGYTPANTDELQKYLTKTAAESTYASISYVDNRWNQAISIIEANFLTKDEADTKLAEKANANEVYTKEEVDDLLSAYESRIAALEAALGTATQMLDELNGEVI